MLKGLQELKEILDTTMQVPKEWSRKWYVINHDSTFNTVRLLNQFHSPGYVPIKYVATKTVVEMSSEEFCEAVVRYSDKELFPCHICGDTGSLIEDDLGSWPSCPGCGTI
jgi:hypothetical protein